MPDQATAIGARANQSVRDTSGRRGESRVRRGTRVSDEKEREVEWSSQSMTSRTCRKLPWRFYTNCISGNIKICAPPASSTPGINAHLFTRFLRKYATP